MKMTHKQAEAYVQDPANWEIIPGNEYFRVARMTFAGNEYLRFDEKVVVNHSEVFGGLPAKKEFVPMYYRRVDEPFSYATREGAIADEIYAAAKKVEDESNR